MKIFDIIEELLKINKNKLIALFGVILLIGCVSVFSFCDKRNTDESLTIETIEDRLYNLESRGRIDLESTNWEDCLGWTYEINEELEMYNKALLQGYVCTVYCTEEETYILEFESVSDAKKAKTVLLGWENEWGYREWQIIRKGKIVLFGEKYEISMIL